MKVAGVSHQDEQGPGEPGGLPDFNPPMAARGQVPVRPVTRPPALPQTARALEPPPSRGQDAPPDSAALPEAQGDLPVVAPQADLAPATVPKRWVALCFGVTLL